MVQHAILECGRYGKERRALKAAMVRAKVFSTEKILLRIELERGSYKIIRRIIKTIYLSFFRLQTL